MQIRVHFQGFEHSPWMEQLITRKVAKLERYLSTSAKIDVFLKCDKQCFYTTISILNKGHSSAYCSSGYNLYESFVLAQDKATNSLSEQKRKLKEKIHRKFVA